ncbi:hypothetical protein BHE74_00058365 [Ensete ventricosum]|nr:hypothetical protein BHE74_00058365 [Ensete ventricosum]
MTASTPTRRHRPSCNLCCSVLFVERTCKGHRSSSLVSFPFPVAAATLYYSLSHPKRRRRCLLYPLSQSLLASLLHRCPLPLPSTCEAPPPTSARATPPPLLAPVIPFLPKSSSSTHLVGCHNPRCLWIHPRDRLSCCPSYNSTSVDGCPIVPCPPYALIYGSGSTTDLLMDLIRFSNLAPVELSVLSQLGCHCRQSQPSSDLYRG